MSGWGCFFNKNTKKRKKLQLNQWHTFISALWVNNTNESRSSCEAEGYPNTLVWRVFCLKWRAAAVKRAACQRKQISELISDLKYAKHTSINDRNLCCCESKLWQTLAVDSYAWFVFKDSSFLVHCRSVSLDCPITVKPLSSGPLLSSHQSNSWNSLHISTVYLTSKVVTSIKRM